MSYGSDVQDMNSDRLGQDSYRQMNTLEPNRASNTQMIMARDSSASSKTGRSMPRKEEENNLNILRGLFMFAIMLCVLLEIYAYYTSRLANSTCLLSLAAISVGMIAASLLGSFGCYRANQDLTSQNPIKTSINAGQEIVLHAIYLIIPILSLYCVAGTAALLFPDEVVAYQRALHQNDPKFSSGPTTLDDYLLLIEVFVTTGGYTTWCIVFVFLCMYYFFFELANEYQSNHTLLQIHNWVLLCLSLGMITCAVYEMNYLGVFGIEENFIDYVPLVVILLGASFVSLSFAGLRAGFTEQQNHIVCYSITLGIFVGLAGVMTAGVFGFSHHFAVQFEDICEQKLDNVGEEYLITLGCVEGKYLRAVDGEYPCLNPVPIPGPGAYEELGCLNIICCETLVSHGTNRFNYMASLGATIILFGVLSLVNAAYLRRKVEKFDRSNVHRYDRFLTVLMSLTLVIGLGLIVFCYQTTPNLKN